MTKLYLVRHGETIDNARQVMQGQVQGQLNDTGIRQAEEVRDRLTDERFDAFISSDLHRAVHTAEIIAAPHGMEVVTTPLLRERDWGDFTGRYIPSLKGEPWPDNVESLEHLLQRARSFLDFVRNGWPEGRVLAVGHGIVNKAIQAALRGVEMRHVEKMKNAEVRVLDI